MHQPVPITGAEELVYLARMRGLVVYEVTVVDPEHEVFELMFSNPASVHPNAIYNTHVRMVGEGEQRNFLAMRQGHA